MVESEWGFAGFVGFLPNEGEVLPGTVEDARNAWFLCVISLVCTFRSPFVTSAPRLISANTAAEPPSDSGVLTGGPGAGGGGGSGGGGILPVAGGALYSLRGMPFGGGKQLEKPSRLRIDYLRIPTQSGGVVFHVVLYQCFQYTHEGPDPLNVFRIPRGHSPAITDICYSWTHFSLYSLISRFP